MVKHEFGFDDFFRISITLLIVILVAFFIAPISLWVFVFSLIVLVFISVLEIYKYFKYVKIRKPKKSKQ